VSAQRRARECAAEGGSTVIAEFGTGQVLWSLLWFFLFLVWVMLVFRVFGDLMQDDEMSGTAKMLWTVAVVVLPYVGALAYLAVHGGRRRATTPATTPASAATFPIGPVSGVDELERLARLHTDGKIDDAEYARLKARVIG
jgi:hypothetical protein